jgi:hypothetical protein
MATTVSLSRKVREVKIPSTPKFRSSSRLSPEDQQAIETYAREVEAAIKALVAVVDELQTALHGHTVG